MRVRPVKRPPQGRDDRPEAAASAVAERADGRHPGRAGVRDGLGAVGRHAADRQHGNADRRDDRPETLYAEESPGVRLQAVAKTVPAIR